MNKNRKPLTFEKKFDNATVLQFPCTNKQFIVTTDACQEGLRAILSQKFNKNKLSLLMLHVLYKNMKEIANRMILKLLLLFLL